MEKTQKDTKEITFGHDEERNQLTIQLVDGELEQFHLRVTTYSSYDSVDIQTLQDLKQVRELLDLAIDEIEKGDHS